MPKTTPSVNTATALRAETVEVTLKPMASAVVGLHGVWHTVWMLGSGYALWSVNKPHTAWMMQDLHATLQASLYGCAVGFAVFKATQLIVSHVPAALRVQRECAHVFAFSKPAHCYGIGLLSAVSEELFFRGLVQPSIGVFLAAVLFGVMHIGPQARFWVWGLVAFGAGCMFGAVLLWTGSLAAAICAHACANVLNMHVLLWGDKRSLQRT